MNEHCDILHKDFVKYLSNFVKLLLMIVNNLTKKIVKK